MTTEYSIQKMVSDGTLSTIALGIQYLQRNDIYIRIAGEETPQVGAPSGYTWSFINNTTLKILPVVPNGVEVVVYRRTDVDAMYNIYSQNAQFDEATIDENNQQLLYIAQEYLEQGIPGAGVDTIEYLRYDAINTYYRVRRTDGTYSEEFAVPSVNQVNQLLSYSALKRTLAGIGLNLVGSFQTGCTVNSVCDVVLYYGTNLEVYYATSGFPIEIPADSTPLGAGGLYPTGVWRANNGREINVANLGVGPDGISDVSPILGYIQSLGSHQVIRLPFVHGTPNIYYFSVFNPSSNIGTRFIVEPGVTVSLPNDNIVGDPNSINQYFTRETKLVFRSLGVNYTAGATNFRPVSVNDTDVSEVSSISPGVVLTPLKVSWPSSDVFESDAFVYTDANSALFQYSPGDGKFHIGAVRPSVGDKYSMALPVNGAALPCVLVQDQGGYSGVYFSTDDTSQCTAFRKDIGVAGTATSINYPMQNNHASYAAVNSEVQLHVVSAHSYDVLLNGYRIASINTAGPIEIVGFGAFFNATADTYAVNILYPTVVRNYIQTCSTFVSAMVFGDSRSSNRMDCWVEKAKQLADGSNGLRLWAVYNYAVAGETSAQQLARMQSANLASANVVVIAVGTNDAQGQVGLSVYRANLEAMCDICIAANKPFIVVKPQLWYTQTESGGSGQASANYALTAQYRAVCSVVCAAKGGKLVDTDSDLGPIVAYYVNPASGVDMTGAGDPVVFDNIHFTSKANDILANAVVKALLGVLCNKSKLGYTTAGLTVRSRNSWVINTGDNPLQISATKDGAVVLTGRVFKSIGSTLDGTVIAKLPRVLSPRKYTEWFVGGDVGRSKVSIDIDGTVKVYSVGTNNYVSLSGCCWTLVL